MVLVGFKFSIQKHSICSTSSLTCEGSLSTKLYNTRGKWPIFLLRCQRLAKDQGDQKNPILLHCAFNLASIFQSCFFPRAILHKQRANERGTRKIFFDLFFYSASWEKANFLSLEGEWLFAVARRQDHLTLFEEFWIKLHFSLSFTTLFSPRLRRRRRGFFLKCRLSSGDTKSRVAFPSHEFRGTVVNKENHFPSVLRVSHQVRLNFISIQTQQRRQCNNGISIGKNALALGMFGWWGE